VAGEIISPISNRKKFVEISTMKLSFFYNFFGFVKVPQCCYSSVMHRYLVDDMQAVPSFFDVL
jgi:hypothetical protein